MTKGQIVAACVHILSKEILGVNYCAEESGTDYTPEEYAKIEGWMKKLRVKDSKEQLAVRSLMEGMTHWSNINIVDTPTLVLVNNPIDQVQ